MSVYVTDLVYKNVKNLTRSAKSLLLFFAFRMDKDYGYKRVFKYDEIAEETFISVSQIKRLIKELEDHNYIDRKLIIGKQYNYSLLVQNIPNYSEEKTKTQAKANDLDNNQEAMTDYYIILNTKKKWYVSQSDYEEWSKLYPNVNLDQTLKNILAWCRENPKKCKNKNFARKFIENWLQREQNNPQFNFDSDSQKGWNQKFARDTSLEAFEIFYNSHKDPGLWK